MPEVWTVAGNCPRGYTETVSMSGGNINLPLEATEYTTTWWVTVAAWCVPYGAQSFAFFSTWNPPELPITWLLRGGTDVESVIAPLYLRAWDAYVSEWLAVNGFTLDLLLLMMLILPILMRPATRRLRLT
jgi:hypothetical protein